MLGLLLLAFGGAVGLGVAIGGIGHSIKATSSERKTARAAHASSKAWDARRASVHAHHMTISDDCRARIAAIAAGQR